MSLTIAVDFDSSIVELSTSGALQFRKGAREALVAFKAQGHRLVLHSCRCNPLDDGPALENETVEFYASGKPSPRCIEQWTRFSEMCAFLQAAEVWDLFDDVWQAPGKPLADVFIDDKAERPEWARLIQEFGATTLGGKTK